MAITQTRIISLINAGRDFQQALEKLISQIESLRSEVESGVTKPESALEILYLNAGPGLLINPAASKTTLLAEHKHFKANIRRNLRSKAKQEKKRRDQGILPRHQPDPFSPLNEHIISQPQQPVPLDFLTRGYSISPSRQREIELEAERALKQKQYLEGKTQATATATAKIDLSSDPDDPENAFGESGTSIISSSEEEK